MTAFTRSVQIEATPEEVWPALADFGGVATWNSGVARSYTTSEAITGIGAERTCEFTQLGATAEEVIAGWDEGRSLTVHILGGRRLPPFDGPAEAVFVLEPSGDERTTVEATVTYRLRGGRIGQLLDATVTRRQLSSGFTGLLAGLKHHIETGETVASTSGLDLAAVSA